MTTPKSHRPWRDRLRDTVDRVDTWINGPDDDNVYVDRPFFVDEDPDDGLPWMRTSDGHWILEEDTVPAAKVSPNVDHTPPPPPAHNCVSLEAYRDQVAGEHHTAHADAYREFADWLPQWWATRLRDAR